MGALPIQEFGDEGQKRILADVASGRVLLTAAFTELGRFDAARPATIARGREVRWALEGTKVCVPDARRARLLVVPASTGPDSVGVFLLPPSGPGVSLERESSTTGEPQFTVVLSDAPASPLGDLGRGAEVVRWIERRALVALCALQLGIAEAALERTAAYARERKQFGRPIGSFQAYRMRAADAFIDVEAIRSTLYQALWAVEADRDPDRAVEVAKWWACRAGHRVAHAAQHLHGGIGADVDDPIHRFCLWAKQAEQTLGGASAHLARLGAHLASARDEQRGF